MKKNLLYTALWLMGLMGTLTIWVVSAETTISEPYWHIEYTLNENENFEAQVITITGDDGTVITILDRNLWATVAWTWCEKSDSLDCSNWDATYGYHFQRGNNYGFKSTGEVQSWTDKAEWNSAYANKWYYGTTFIKSYAFIPGWDYWSDWPHDDLWWGSLTETTDGAGNIIWDPDYLNWNDWKVNPDTVKNRQWPCPENFHVPSIWELVKIKTMMWVVSKMHFQLKIPFASVRDNVSASVSSLGSNANLWSSSPSRGLSLSMDDHSYHSIFYRPYGMSVRCFYDFYQPFTQSFTLSFTGSEWGSVSTWSIEAEEWSSISRDDIEGTVSISWAVVVTGIADEWYVFSGWLTDCDGGTVTTGCSFTGVFKLETYMITYELNWWTNNENNLTWYTIKDSITFANPTKEWFTFDGWFTDAQFTTWITSISTWTTWPITVYAKWTENKKSSWSSGWGGRSNKTSDKDKDTTNNPSVTDVTAPLESGAQWDSNDGSPLSRGDTASAERGSTQNYTQEFQEAYEFAKEKWITTMPTINEANMNWKLTRIAMAKMLSQYAMNVLGQKPANIVTPKFNDVTDKQNSDYDDWVTLAYQLWIMWQNMPNNKFRPNDEVTRAEFATALSRMLYNTSDWEYKSTDKYYTNHMKKLVQEKIITNDDAKMKELRWYVMIMLMRSAK